MVYVICCEKETKPNWTKHEQRNKCGPGVFTRSDLCPYDKLQRITNILVCCHVL